MGLMKAYLTFFLVILLSSYASALVVTVIDGFTPNVPALQLFDTNNTNNLVVTKSSNGNNTLGTEREQILVLEPGLASKIITTSIAGGSWTNGYSQETSGWSIIQYDGIDNGSPNLTFPGLNGVDLTAGDAAFAFYFKVKSDLPAIYQFLVYTSATEVSTVEVEFDPANYPIDAIVPYLVPFSTFVGNADFTNVGAIEVVLNQTLLDNPVNNFVYLLSIFGYVISGEVFFDCNDNGVLDGNESGAVGATVTLLNSTGQAIETQLTNINGDFSFDGLVNGTYQVCISGVGKNASPTNTQNGCISNVIVQNATDVLDLSFGFFIPTTLTPPVADSVPCGSCLTPNCTGEATGVGCSTVPVITYTDSDSSTCPEIITRTFSAAGAASVTQTITVTDTNPPTIVTPPTPVSVSCSVKSPTINNWVANDAFATVSDCTPVTWVNNWNGSPAPNCGTVTVQFTATDACKNSLSFTSTYSLFDNTAPVFTKGPQNSSAQCDIVGNTDIAAFNAWLLSHANATASDACFASTSLNWSNNNQGQIQQSCQVNKNVVFTVSDACNNSASASATFSIFDTIAPVITTQASPLSVICSSQSQSAFQNWLLTHANATATDNCTPSANLIWVNNFQGAAPSGCNAGTTVVFTVTDLCGNSQSTTSTFTVTSSTGPVLNKPAQPLNVVCSATNSSEIIDAYLQNNGGAVATDSCTAVVWTNTFTQIPSGTCNQAPITFTGCNQCSPPLCVSTTTTITIVDHSAPVFITAPANPVVNCDAFALQQFTTWLNTAGGATVTDNCTPQQSIVITNNWPQGKTITSGCNNAATVSFFATDLCGNISPAEIGTFRVLDSTPPSITQAANLSVECDNSALNSYTSWLNSHGGATGSDVCGNITWSYIGPSNISLGCDVIQTVTFVATDTCALTSKTTATFTMVDTDPPIITQPALNLNTTCSTNVNNTLSNWLFTHGGAQAVDNCTPLTWSYKFNGLNGLCTLSSVVVFVVSDECGNSVATTATFSVVDDQGPIITSPALSTSVPCDEDTEGALDFFLNSHGGAVAFDPCQPAGNLQWSNDFSTAPTQCGSILVTFTVNDGCGVGGASTTASFSVTDHFPPTVTNGLPQVYQCDGYGNVEDYNTWLLTHGGVTASDPCSLNLSWSTDAPETGPVGCGTVTATFIVTDGCNNTGSGTGTYAVVDSTPPTIFPQAGDEIVQCDGEGNINDLTDWLNGHAGAFAIDQCSGNSVNWTYTLVNVSSSSYSCTNFSTYSFVATDECGNSAVTTATFGITDTVPPTFTTPPSSLIIQCGTNNVNQINSWVSSNAGAVAEDNCLPFSITNDYVQQVNPGFGCFNLPITFTATDSCGHFSTATANLILQDNVEPVFLNFPPNLTLPCDADTSTTYTGIPGVSDACFSNLNPFVYYNDTQIDLPPNLNTPQCPGNIIINRTFTVSDPCGNTVSQSQIITVEIALSSGPCDSSNCVCHDECCPEPQTVNCLPTECLPQTCTPSYCEAVPCSCGFGKRDIQGDYSEVGFLDSPVPQCEPTYIFVHDDDANDDDDGDNSVSITNPKLNNYVISEFPIPQEQLDKMKNRNHFKNSKPQVTTQQF